MRGGAQQYYSVPFSLTDADRQELVALAGPSRVFLLSADLKVRQYDPTPQEEQELTSGKSPRDRESEDLVAGPALPATTTAPAARLPLPQVGFLVFDKANLISQDDPGTSKPVAAPAVPPAAGEESRTFAVQLAGKTVEQMLQAGPPDRPGFRVEVVAVTPTVEYGADSRSTRLGVYDIAYGHARGAATPVRQAPAGGEYLLLSKTDGRVYLGPLALAEGDALGVAPAGATEKGRVVAVAGSRRLTLPDGDYFWLRPVKQFYPSEPGAAGKKGAEAPGEPARPQFLARFGRAGMQIGGRAAEPGAGEAGRDAPQASMGVFEYHGVDARPGPGGTVSLQMHVAVERGGEVSAEGDATSRAAVRVRNRKTGRVSDPVEYLPETSRVSYVDFPAEYFDGGEFDVVVQGLTRGQWIGLSGPAASTPSAAVVTARGSFELNLFKSLLILWLLSVLVVVIAVFCSTFLSWPIAVVLTLLLLLGRWGVDQLGDALAPGSARSMASDIFGLRDAARQKAVTSGVETLSTMLRAMASVLPDVTRFPVIEDINRGVVIPAWKIGGAGMQLVWFGLPLLVLTYLIFRSKEVAP